MTETALLVAHWVCNLLMTGLIWFVQVVHYPLMAKVGKESFSLYSQLHQRKTTLVVAGPMLLEAATAAALFGLHPTLLLSPYFAVATGLLLVVWISTAFLQVPLHGKLANGFDESIISKLVLTNWIRTIAWTVRAILLAEVLATRLYFVAD